MVKNYCTWLWKKCGGLTLTFMKYALQSLQKSCKSETIMEFLGHLRHMNWHDHCQMLLHVSKLWSLNIILYDWHGEGVVGRTISDICCGKGKELFAFHSLCNRLGPFYFSPGNWTALKTCYFMANILTFTGHLSTVPELFRSWVCWRERGRGGDPYDEETTKLRIHCSHAFEHIEKYQKGMMDLWCVSATISAVVEHPDNFCIHWQPGHLIPSDSVLIMMVMVSVHAWEGRWGCQEVQNMAEIVEISVPGFELLKTMPTTQHRVWNPRAS